MTPVYISKYLTGTALFCLWYKSDFKINHKRFKIFLYKYLYLHVVFQFKVLVDVKIIYSKQFPNKNYYCSGIKNAFKFILCS